MAQTTQENCLEKLIGISQLTCECWENIPNDYQESETGIYIDEIGGLGKIFKHLCNNPHCGLDVWESIYKFRTDAANCVMRDLATCLTFKKEVNPKISQRNFLIGNETAGTYKKVMNNYVVLRLDIGCGKDIAFCLNSIGLQPFKLDNKTQAVTREIEIYSGTGELLTTSPINITTDKYKAIYHTFDTPLTFCPNDINGCLYLVYECQENEDLRYNDNVTWCGCSSKQPDWAKHITAHAKGFDDIGLDSGCEVEYFADKLKNTNCCESSKNSMMGFALDFSFVCDIESIICQKVKAKYSVDRTTIAELVKNKVAVLFAEWMLGNDSVDFSPLSSEQRMLGYLSHYRSVYNKMLYGDDKSMIGICNSMNLDDSDCFCKKTNKGVRFGLSR